MKEKKMLSKTLPISEYQKRFFLEWALAPNDSTYNTSLVNRITGFLDEKTLKRACEVFIKQNEVTHARYSEDGLTCYYGNYEIDEFYHESVLDLNYSVESQLRAVLNTPFDLTKDVLLRLYLIKNSKPTTPEYYFVICAHHIIADAISALQITKKVQEIYNLLIIGADVSVEVDNSFLQAVKVEQQMLSEEYTGKAQKFWLDFIDDSFPEPSLPYRSNVNPINFDDRLSDKTGEFVYFDLDPEQTAQLKAYAKRNRTTVFIALSTIYGLVLSKYSNQKKIILSYPINMRPKGFNDVLGCFVNNLPLKIDFSNATTIKNVLKSLGEQRKEVKPYQGYSLVDIIQDQRKYRNNDFNKILKIGFVQANLNTTILELNGVEVSPVDISSSEKVDFEVTLLYDEYSTNLVKFKFEYRKALFDKELMHRLINSFKSSISEVLNGDEILVNTFSVLSPSEYNTVVYQWNATDKAYPKDKTIHGLFHEQVERTPDNIAIVFEGQSLSYRELNKKSNQLARYIRKSYKEKTHQELKADTLIALYLERSLEMIIGVLSVLKAGGAYVPIDTSYPKERLDYMLEDIEAELILSQKHVSHSKKTSLPVHKVLHIDLSEDIYGTEDLSNLPSHSQPADLAYVIYTSGTTGKPKGVMIEHGGVVNLMIDLQSKYCLSSEERFILLANYVFDASVEQLFIPLLSGGVLFIPDNNTILETSKIENFIKQNKITHIDSTPSYINSIDPSNLSSLRRVVFGAEYLPKQLFDRYKANIPTVINEYGPTETTIVALISIDSHLLNKASIQNTRAYILDTNHLPTPIGVVGELYIGGAGLARGYLNQLELTAERFIPNLFATGNNKLNNYKRLYKTGDLMRWLPDGNIEFIGRNDDQIKIRGFRVELGEIEQAMLQIPGIKQSCVLPRERKTGTGINKYLVGYYVPDHTAQTLSHYDILEKLTQMLPDYMVPLTLVKMETFPHTINGKLDKRALPEPEFISETECYVIPHTEIESQLCIIWQEVIGVKCVGVTDDFFRIGGDSILSIQVSSRIRQIGLNCEVKDIFEHRSIARLAEHLIKKSAVTNIQSEHGILTGSFELLPIQQWFFEKVGNGEFPEAHHWNQSFLVKTPELSIDRLEAALENLVVHHDMLRVRFIKENDSRDWRQVYQMSTQKPVVKTLDVSKHNETEINEVLTSWQSGFHLEQGPLFQVGYLHGYKDGSARLSFALHHLIVDAVSCRILAEDTKVLYQGGILPEKGSSYRQWVRSVRQYPRDHPQEEIYWKEQLGNIPCWLESIQAEASSTSAFVELDSKLTDLFLHHISAAYHTQINDLLLTALAYSLKAVNRSDVQGVTLEGHGREDIDEAIDISRTVGWFTTMLPVRLELQETLGKSIQRIKESLRSIPNKGIGFGAFAAGKESEVSYHDLSPILFNYLGQFDSPEQTWQITPEGSGGGVHAANTDNSLVCINGGVSSGKLMFIVTSRLGQATTHDLAVQFKAALVNIIEHCKEQLETVGSSSTPSDFAHVCLSQQLIDCLEQEARAHQREIQHIYPCTSLQQGFIYHALSQREDDAYRVQLLYDYQQKLDVGKYILAWETCIKQYPILRTAFNWEEEMIQIIYKEGELRYQVHDISHLASQLERDAAIDSIQIEDRRQPFDLTQPTLLRLHIIKQSNDYYTILNSEHHSITDGWSGPILLTSLHGYYEQFVEGREVTIREDEAYMQAQEYALSRSEAVGGYWEGVLATIEGANDINPLLSRPIELGSYRRIEDPGVSTIEIKADAYKKLKDFCTMEGVTLNVIAQLAWHKLLHVYSSSRQSIVGTTVSGRDMPIEGIESSVGLYINTLPLIIDWDNENSVQAQLHQIQQRLTELNTHSTADLVTMQKRGERIFFSLFVFESYPIPKDSKHLSCISIRKAIEKVDYPLLVMAYEQEGGLTVQLQYDRVYLTGEKADEHMATLGYILHEVVGDSQKRHKEIGLLRGDNYQKIVHQWNATDKTYPKDKTIHRLFQEQAQRTPEHIAIVYDGQTLTYQQVNEKSNQLARHIRAQYKAKTHQELKADTLIALYLERSLEMIIGIQSVLKAGGAYVPMDTSYPQERIDYMLEDTGAELILSQKNVIEANRAQLPIDKIILIDLTEGLFNIGDTSNLPQHSNATDLAYVIYTSGTTGKPKGAMLNHTGIVNRLGWMQAMYPLNSEDAVLQKTPYVFDVSVWELLWAHWYGAKIVLAKPEGHKDSEYLHQLIEKSKVTTLHFVPSMLDAYNQYLIENRIKLSTGIKQIFCSGEALNKNVVEQTYQNSESKIFRLHNLYGPTEASVDVTYFETSSNKDVYIGRPIDNTQVYILDSNNAPVPIGVIGELYLGGIGLSRGYLKRPELTAERFVPNPFATVTDKANGYDRLYRTGDLVRWMPDGNIEFIGRNDSQVKIRGFRIELGEIEQAILQIPGVKQSCVMDKERKSESENNKYLVAYYVLDGSDIKLTRTDILDKLSRVLPEYMMPNAVMPMNAFPLTINGKLDKRSLPDPEFGREEDYVEPKTNLEFRLCQLYAEVLGLETNQVSTQQGFFRMGGNSILSIRLKQKLNQLEEFRHVSIADLFKFNSISKLIQSVQQDNQVLYNLQSKAVINKEHEIAIIGVSGAFSGGSSIAELWQLIANQGEGIQFYGKDECREWGGDESLFEDPNYIPVSGRVKDIELFDPLFWDISPNEAKLLDPQIRKFIEHCWFALESSGYAHQRKSLNVGVFAGSGQSNYFYDHILNEEMVEQINLWDASVSNSKDALATKTSFFLGLSGTAISINTGCSTGLVSVVEACRNLRLGVCNMALAGGVSLSMPEQVGYVYQEGMIASKDGHCKTFDKDASGTTEGSGVGVVLLKRLADAIRDNDAIFGVIKGYASNNDGDRKTGYTAPSVIGQSECIINAQMMAGINPEQIDYIECHGTATHLGDPIEVQALREAFEYNRPKENRSKRKTILGAVKANIGHADSAAGIAGLIKICTMLLNDTLPGQVNFNEPNPELHLDQTNFEIIKENRKWLPNASKQRLAGVSSFGIGGTNAHVIIGDYSPVIQELKETSHPKEKQDDLTQYIIPISARNRQSLEQYRQELAKYLDKASTNGQPINLQNITYTLQERRENFNFRSAYCARNVSELLDKLRIDISYVEINAESSNKVVFMFPGQGVQYAHMAKALYDNEQYFKDCIDQCIAIANRHVDVNLFDVMYPREEVSSNDINETQWTQVSLFTIEYALAKYLESLGVIADAYIGHSIGEYVAATLSGVFTLEDAIRVVIARGQLMQALQPGSMLAINAKEDAVRAIIEEYGCEIAVINSTEDIVASGTNEAIKMLKVALDSRAISTINLTTSHAFHSRMMDEAAHEFEGVFKNIKLKKPTKYFVSNLTGEIAKEEVTTSDYWCKQLRNTVQFAKGVDCLSRQYNHHVSFIEVGTGKGLSSFVNKYKATNGYKSIQTLQLLPSSKETKTSYIINSKEDIKVRLWMSNIIRKPNESDLFQNAKLVTGLPTYQFNYQKCWLEKNKIDSSNTQLKLLPKEKWLSVPVWSAVSNLNKYNNDSTKFRNALVFIREDQISVFDFTNLAQDTHLISLDINNSNLEILGTSDQIKINPRNTQHFEKLAEYLKAKSIAFDTIIHASSVNNVSHLDEALCYSFYSLFLVRQHLLGSTTLRNLVVITNGLAQVTNEDIINPSNGSLVGAIRNINHEFLNIDARVIDVGFTQEGITSNIIQVINNEGYQKSEELLALKFGKLWVERFERINSPIPNVCTIEDGDVILITGGLGGIALAIANHISSKHCVKFILVSRNNIYDDKYQSDYITQKIDLIERIKANGSFVDIQCADISDTKQVKILVNNINKTFGNITGIIHTAGVSPIKEYNLESIKAALLGKVYGIYNIINAVSKNHLKFLVSTSSLASIMGDVNRFEYCASNSYLDYLSTDKLSFKNTKVISINWPGWSDTGMVKEHSIPGDNKKPLEGIQQLICLNSVEQVKGAELFYNLINQTEFVQVIISKLDIDKVRNKLFKQIKAPTFNKQIVIMEDSYTETEYKIAQIFGDALGIEQISLHDDFFSIGGNSILAIQVSHRISKILGYNIMVADLFKNSTPSKLCKSLLVNVNDEVFTGENWKI